MDPTDYFRLAVQYRVLGDIQPERFEPPANLHQVLHQESLATADVEYAVASFQTEVLDDVLGNRDPAPVVAIAAVALLPRTVKVLLAELQRDATVFFLVAKPRFHVALDLRISGKQVYFGH